MIKEAQKHAGVCFVVHAMMHVWMHTHHKHPPTHKYPPTHKQTHTHKHPPTELAQQARSSTNTAAFITRNTRRPGFVELDLHHMHVTEGVGTVSRYMRHLAALQHPGGWRMMVITGYGKHLDQRATLRNAVTEYLAAAQHVYRVCDDNAGAVEVLV